MEKPTIVKTIHGCFLAAPTHIAEEHESDSETEEETDEDDYNIELGDDNLPCSASEQVSVNRVRLKKTVGRVLLLLLLSFML